MKLESIKLKNFRGYKSETIVPISDLTALIGKNDSGKSTVLEALEIFFNNTLIECEKEDLNIHADSNNIEITCVFSDFPTQLVIDTANPTSLDSEYLLNSEGKLEIKKIFQATAVKPKEKVFIVCNHPTVDNASDLLLLKINELRQRADEIQIAHENYNRKVNSSIRKAIWDNFRELNLKKTQLSVDKEDSKKIYEKLKEYLPLFALFQSDRQSKDDDKEVTDPMKVAVRQALAELDSELEHIKKEVRKKALDTAERTLNKLQEMSPELAQKLTPDFKTEPKFDSQFKLSINSEDDIPINKRGSGVRRLVLLNFFRAEAERKRAEHEGNQIIFAFEEPETSQHPEHQQMLVEAFKELSSSENTQIILSTHTPALASILPLESLRYVEFDGEERSIELGTDEVFEKIAETLGILADPISKNARALLLVEGKSDITFINHAAEELKRAGYISHTFEEKRFAIVPIGGCGNLKHWRTLKLAEQFEIPYCVLLDSDKGTKEEQKNIDAIQEIKQNGIKAYLTRKREPENYIHYDVLNLPQTSSLSIDDEYDAKTLIAAEKVSRKQNVIEDYWTLMSAEQIREVERYTENGNEYYEFTDMFTDFLSIVE